MASLSVSALCPSSRVSAARAASPAARLTPRTVTPLRSTTRRGHVARASAVTPVAPVAPVKIPRSLAEVDNGKVLGFGADLSEDHPGFKDPGYKQRRVDICNIARTHEIGEPIPRIEYTAREKEVWHKVWTQLEPLLRTHACRQYLESVDMFGFTADDIPQLEDMSAVLQRTTGFQIRPVAGLLHPRDFLNGLAFRTFHSTQYVRHASRPEYTPEPDIVHEMIGHVPMLVHPDFCDLVHAIGVASLGADECTIWHLTKCYWFTVEFGVVREQGLNKAFGAGILSSFGELLNMASDAPAFVPFDPFAKQPKMSYKDGYQTRYFVLESFEHGAQQLRDYCNSLHQDLPEEVRAVIGRV